MDLTGTHLQVDALEDRLILHGGVKIGDLEKQLSVGADHVGEAGNWKD